MLLPSLLLEGTFKHGGQVVRYHVVHPEWLIFRLKAKGVIVETLQTRDFYRKGLGEKPVSRQKEGNLIHIGITWRCVRFNSR